MKQDLIQDEATATWLLKRAKTAGMFCILDEDVWFLTRRDFKKNGSYKREEAIDIEKKRNIADVIEKLLTSEYLKFDGKCESIDCRMKRYVPTAKGIEFQSWEQESEKLFKSTRRLPKKQDLVEEKLERTKKKKWSWEQAAIWQKLLLAVLVLITIYGTMNLLMLFF